MPPIQHGVKTDLRAFWGFPPIEGQGFRRIETDESEDGGGVRLPGRLPDELVKKSLPAARIEPSVKLVYFAVHPNKSNRGWKRLFNTSHHCNRPR